MIRKIPVVRFCDPGEVGHAELILAFDMFGFITGVTLPVDGGYAIQ